MGVISLVGKIVLVVVNMLILLLSLALLACGVILIAGKDLYNSLLTSMEDQLKSGLTSAGVSIDTSSFSISDLMLPLAYGVIALGLVMGALALLGCCGGCYTIKIVLVVYVIITGVMFVVQLVIVIVVYTDRSVFDSTAKSYIKGTLDDYAGIEGTDAKSLAWNALMNYEGCCGVDSYADFTGLTNWPPTTIASTAVSDLKTPIMCCKTIPTVSTGYACATNAGASDSLNWQSTGCYDKLFDLLTENTYVKIAFGLMLGFQFVLIFFTIWILCTMDNKIDII